MYSTDGVNWSESGYNPIQELILQQLLHHMLFGPGIQRINFGTDTGLQLFLAFSVYEQNYISQAEYVLKVASSSMALSSMDAEQAVDNNSSTFWSSAGHTTPGNVEWIYINTGFTGKISQVSLLPRVVAGKTMCFPVNFNLQYSLDGITWTDVSGQSYTNYSCSDTTAQVFNFSSAVTAQYIRLYATKLSPG